MTWNVSKYDNVKFLWELTQIIVADIQNILVKLQDTVKQIMVTNTIKDKQWKFKENYR